MRTTTVLLAAASLLAGCGSISGISGVSEFECKAPKGVPCMSISGVYENVRAGNVPGSGGAEVASKREPAMTNAADSPQVNPAGNGVKVDLSTPASLATAAQAQPGAFAKVSPATMNVPASGTPLRTPERILRIWIAPMEDTEGTLHDQRYVYIQVDRGQWLLDAFQDSARRTYAPVKRLQSQAERAEQTGPSAGEAAQESARRNGRLFAPGPVAPNAQRPVPEADGKE
jgi:conjugal transfer pilus assembly protein TraV